MPTTLSRTRWTSASKAALVERLKKTTAWPEWAAMESAIILTPGSAGEGSAGEVRQFKAGRTTGREQVLPPQGDKVLRYRLLSGLPLKDYIGEVEIVDEGDKRRVTWSASFEPPVPFTGWLMKRGLTPYFDRWIDGLVSLERPAV